MRSDNKTPYEDIFGVPADPGAGEYQDSLHAIGAKKQIEAANLMLQAAVNKRYAQANRDTFAHTGGRLGSIYMAEVHEACAKKKLAQAELLFPSDNTAIYDSIGQIF